MARTQNAADDASVSLEFENDLAYTPDPGTTSITTERATTLDEVEAQFKAIALRAQALAESAGDELCATAPAPGSWSAAACLQHLNILADNYFPIWQQVIASAGPRRAALNAPYHLDFFGRLLSWILEPPPRVRTRTPVRFEPGMCGEFAPVLDGFLERQQRIIATLHRCRGRAIDHVRMSSLLDSRIQYSIWSSFVINTAHQRRHLWQAEQALKTLRART